MNSPYWRWLTIFSVLVLLTLGALQRVYPTIELVYDEQDEASLLGVDPFFHLRHVEQLVKEYPTISRRDIGASYPSGYSDDATGLLALTSATAVRIIYGSNASMDNISEVMAWVPVVLGVIALWLVFLIANAIAGPFYGLSALLMALLYPATTLNRSVIGFTDHHIVEVVLVLLMTFGFVKLLLRANDNSSLKEWRPAFLLGSGYFLLYFSWIGAPMYLIIFALLFIPYVTWLLFKGRSLHGFSQACFEFFAPAILVLLLALLFFDSFIVSANAKGLIPAVIAATVACAVGPWILSTLVDRLRTKKWPPAYMALGFFGIAFCFAYVFFNWTDVGASAFSTIFKERSYLIREQANLSLTKILKNMGAVGYLTIGVVPIVLWDTWKHKSREPLFFVVSLSITMIYVWITANDFDYIPAPLLALGAGYFLFRTSFFWLHFAWPQKAPVKKKKKDKRSREPIVVSPKKRSMVPRALIAVLFFIIFAGAPMWPLEMSWPIFKLSKGRQLSVYSPGMLKSMEWLKENSPDPWSAGPFAKPDYGVYSVWDLGNIVGSHGNRAPLYSRYPRVVESGFLVAPTEDEALAKICPDCSGEENVRYVVADAKTAGEFFAAKAMSGGVRLTVQTEDTFSDLGDGEPDVPHSTYGAKFDSTMISYLYMNNGTELGRFRMLYESEEESFLAYRATFVDRPGGRRAAEVKRVSLPLTRYVDGDSYRQAARVKVIKSGGSYMYDAKIEPTIKIFEVVQGATFTGQIPLNTELEVGLILKSTRREAPIRYRRMIKPDEAGNIEFTVPYAQAVDSSRTINADSPYILSLWQNGSRISRSIANVTLDETDISQGSKWAISPTRGRLNVTRTDN